MKQGFSGKRIVGVMGKGDRATGLEICQAYQLGKLIAENGWVLLTGGRKVGVMDAANRGAKSAGGLTIGILPGKDKKQVSEAVDIAIVTDLGHARNNINVLSSDVIIACGIGTGTASEIALALKNNQKVILLTADQVTIDFFSSLAPEQIFIVRHPQQAIALVKQFLGNVDI
ncbi:MAG: TIGR00725 family protein [Xenococcaceae cyanobacterium MO_207.B15]|nr:TIGR00725 family protein [Xenococcaceae cyanobacterium MO_207.B15]MDJ0742554.1 TIGR00725 family protein [Xenococcaceae cyanobacterium MO_167.B27]